jgi:phosphoribosylformylglycinamidine cyclo-ligase
MPGFYADGEYDLAVFIVGVVEKARIIDGRAIAPGDVLIGLPSTGLHTNGYSLARQIVFETAGWKLDTLVPELGTTVADALLAPHRSYLRLIGPLLERGLPKGLAHITGGGMTDNLPRVLPEGCAAEVNVHAWKQPPIFQLLQQRGRVSSEEMFRVFNMGIGLVVMCAAGAAERIIDAIAGAGEPDAKQIGSVVSGDRFVRYV